MKIKLGIREKLFSGFVTILTLFTITIIFTLVLCLGNNLT